MEKIIKIQPIINIGCLGSVSDGKTTLINKLTGIKTQRHSDELHRNITIKQGYGNMKVWLDPYNSNYYTSDSNALEYITEDNDECSLVNHISFVDCPGHQELIQTMLSSISLMDGAIVVIAADQPLTKKPQLIQHLAAAKLGKIKNIIICMNKIDLVTKSILYERKEELDQMLIEYDINPFTIIPTCFNKKIGINYLIDAIMQLFNPTKYLERSNDLPIFRISRSFDINKPGTNWNNVSGGVIGGSLLSGKLKVGDEIEIKPGQISKGKDGKIIYQSIKTTILSIKTDTTTLTEIIPGGLIGIGTDLDPYYCKNDMLSGNIVGFINKLPNVYTNINIKVTMIKLFNTIWEPKINDKVMLQIGTKICEAKLNKYEENIFNFELLKPVCISYLQHIIICININKILKIVAEGENIN
jgi:translation initiation factor 2 subunit 3